MLATLERGITGGKWYSLIDKLYPQTTLRLAFDAVAANRGAAGIDHVGIKHYAANLDANLARLTEVCVPAVTGRRRSDGTTSLNREASRCAPWGYRRCRTGWCKPLCAWSSNRPFERDFAAHSYGFRPNRGCKDALRRVDALLKSGHVHVVDADLKSYFDTIPKDRLLALVANKVADSRILGLV